MRKMQKYKNILKKITLTINLCLIGIPMVKAASNPYQPTSPFGINCTWYAWKNAYEIGHVALPGWGDARTWADYAVKAGYEVGTTPRNNSILVDPLLSGWGHVMYVEKVDGGFMYVYDTVDPCYDENDPKAIACKNSTTDPETGKKDYDAYKNCLEKNLPVIGCPFDITYYYDKVVKYIYLDTAPKKGTSTKPNPKPVVTPQKSNDASLKNLTIQGIDFQFNKDTLEYELNTSGIDTIVIEATASNSAAKIEGAGSHKLDIGLNKFEVVVTAEDGTKKTYTFNITKKDNNSSLKSLKISEGQLDFKSDIFEYNVSVSNEVKKIKIDAIPESDLAKIKGLNEYDLKEGNNIINIIVTAEDESTSTYIVTINRKAENIVTKDTVTKDNQKSNLKYYIVGSIIILTIIFIIIFCIFKHKEKSKIANKSFK